MTDSPTNPTPTTKIRMTAPLSDKVTISARGISFQEGLTIEEWRTTLAMLKAVKDGYYIALADTIAYGRRNYGETVVAETIVQLEFPQADFNQAADIARIPIGLRESTDGLTSEHYHVVGSVFADDEKKQEKWLTIASSEHLTARELRRSVEVGEIVRDDPKRTGRESGGIVTIQSIMFSFSQWTKQVGGETGVLRWTEADRREWLKKTEEFAQIREAVQKSLPAVLGAEY